MNCKNLIFSIWKKIDLKIFCECPSKKKIDKRDDNNKGTVHSLNSLPCFYPPNFASTNGNTTEKLWAAEERNYRHEKKNASIKERGEKEKSIFGSNISNGIYKKSAFCPIFICIFTTQLYFFSSNISAVSRTYTNAHIEEEKKNFLVDLKAPKKSFTWYLDTFCVLSNSL